VNALPGWLLGTFAGRALVIGAALKALAAVTASAVLDAIAGVALAAGVAVLAWRLSVMLRRRLLWRVRRKLTLSYIFIGFVPALLIVCFFLLCGLLLFFNVSAFMLRSRVTALVEQARFLAHAAALDLQDAAAVSTLRADLDRRHASAMTAYPLVSYAVVSGEKACGLVSAQGRGLPVDGVVAGPWTHLPAPTTVPDWVPCSGYAGLVTFGGDGPSFAARGVAWIDGASGTRAVVVDIPLSPEVVHQLQDDTGIILGDVTSVGTMATRNEQGELERRVRIGPANISLGRGREAEQTGTLQWVAFLQETDWNSGATTPLTVAFRMSVGDIYNRISGPPLAQLGTFNFGQILLVLVAVVAGLFLVIQVVALGMGLALARSITGSVHELFRGTERVKQQDFTYRIPIRSRDQLGELAESFNRMTASIPDLLLQKAAKEQLEQDLRFAREIQMSLLPHGPLRLPGIALTGHCEPARQVGGDYYDFVPLDERTVAILIADVSGKGASAALYMAVLKGIILSLSQQHRSPRALLIAANGILSRHLDSRSFITITYAVIDLEARTLTYARAGHCPLIYMPGPWSDGRRVQILAPDGLVLGLQIDDDGQMFTRLLEESTLPLGPGDLFVLYTDGITEATNPSGDYFGEQRLGELVQAHAHLPFEEVRERILREVTGFVGTSAQQDDMTMLLLKVEESPALVT
jgi:phosphoserine phosphatase RsbU/P